MRRIISAIRRGNRLRLLALSVLVVAVLVGTTGCYTKLNGGGWMQSANGQGRATFGIHYDYYNKGAATGTYQDKAAGVSVAFSDVVVPDNSDPECATYSAFYRTQDKNVRNRDDQFAILTACDNGEPHRGFVGDTLSIELLGGPPPYRGYTNSGPILGGNLNGLETN